MKKAAVMFLAVVTVAALFVATPGVWAVDTCPKNAYDIQGDCNACCDTYDYKGSPYWLACYHGCAYFRDVTKEQQCDNKVYLN